MANSLKLYVDPNNANPSRLSRLPNAMRLDSLQELYALNIGSKSWQDFEAQIQAEAIGNRISLDVLSKFDAENDPDNILGNRWLCKGGSCLFVGQSGIGKSSLCMQIVDNTRTNNSPRAKMAVKPLKRSIMVNNEHTVDALTYGEDANPTDSSQLVSFTSTSMGSDNLEYFFPNESRHRYAYLLNVTAPETHSA